MGYTNSPLVSYVKLSPNKNSPRNHAIDTITIHCMAGNCTVETCGNIFASPARQASSNYGIGSDGRIAMYVEEKDRSWCSSNAANDNRAITIEVANDGGAETGWHVSDKAMESLINLCVDICKRNGIKQLLWKGDKSLIGQVDKQNMTVHRWFANKACPGDYLYNKHFYIAEEVNKRLGTASIQAPNVLYRVQTGAFSAKSNADALAAKLKAKGFDTYMVKVGNLYKVQVGAFSVKSNADATMKKLKDAGFEAFITTESGTPVTIEAPTSNEIKVGSKVMVKPGAKTYTGGNLSAFVYKTVYDVMQIDGDRIVIGIGKAVTAAVKKSDLILK